VVTRQLLQFSRRAAHRPEVVELGAAVSAAAPVLRRLLGQDRLLDVVADVATRVWFDPVQLEQLVVSLALNARDAMPRGGTLTITTTETEVPGGVAAVGGVAIPAGRYAALRVADTGTGMDDGLQAKIFEPFFSTKPVGRGTGLGLAAVFGIVAQNEGYITVASAPGRGATFTIFLPILPVADVAGQGEAQAGAGAALSPAGATLLVVDDEPAVRTSVARLLQRSGFQVLCAADGTEALDVVERHGAPQLVLTDLTMPGMHGGELARRLRTRWPELAIVFMSGHSAEELTGSEAAGFEAALLQKPFAAAELVTCVNEALAKVPWPGPAST
jgi:CheY-like chemotaxis protein